MKHQVILGSTIDKKAGFILTPPALKLFMRVLTFVIGEYFHSQSP